MQTARMAALPAAQNISANNATARARQRHLASVSSATSAYRRCQYRLRRIASDKEPARRAKDEGRGARIGAEARRATRTAA